MTDKEFWELCGFEWHEMIELWNDPIRGLVSSILPPIDLNNLFKYAVPKLQDKGFEFCLSDSWGKPPYHAEIYRYGDNGEFLFKHVINYDPAQALKEAISKALGGKDGV